jgi:hypothetical protein
MLAPKRLTSLSIDQKIEILDALQKLTGFFRKSAPGRFLGFGPFADPKSNPKKRPGALFRKVIFMVLIV